MLTKENVFNIIQNKMTDVKKLAKEQARIESYREQAAMNRELAGDEKAHARRIANLILDGSLKPAPHIERWLMEAGIDIISEALATMDAPVTRAAVKAPAEVSLPVAGPAAPITFDGTYTVGSPKGTHRTFRLRTRPSVQDQLKKNLGKKPFAPGEQVIGMLTGSDNENDYTEFAFVAHGRMQVWGRFKATDTVKAGQTLLSLLLKDELGEKLLAAGYTVMESRRCFRCGRKLTTVESLSLGIGPECATK
jgi:hypothetical protein